MPVLIYHKFIYKNQIYPGKLNKQKNRCFKGLKLKNHYVHSSCTPSRAALLTGRYASNTGLPCAMFPGSVAGQNSLRFPTNVCFIKIRTTHKSIFIYICGQDYCTGNQYTQFLRSWHEKFERLNQNFQIANDLD